MLRYKIKLTLDLLAWAVLAIIAEADTTPVNTGLVLVVVAFIPGLLAVLNIRRLGLDKFGD